MSYEELEPAKFEWQQSALTIAFKPDFDDIKEVQRYLLMKQKIKHVSETRRSTLDAPPSSSLVCSVFKSLIIFS